MHRDEIHEAYAHYGIRGQRYKIIYWYAESFDLPGTRAGGQQREWELFDCQEDPLELFNVWSDPKYSEVREEMLLALNNKMLEIGDCPVHKTGVSAAELAQIDSEFQGTNMALKANEKNL